MLTRNESVLIIFGLTMGLVVGLVWATPVNNLASLFSSAGITAIATALLTIVTVGLVVVAWRQFVTTRAQLRAYVFVTSKLEPVSADTVRCDFEIQNTGQTPAYGITDQLVVWFDNHPVHGAIPKDEGEPSSLDIGPGDKFTLSQEIAEISTNDWISLRAEKTAIWAVGVLKYRDTFGAEHSTYFKTYMTGNRFDDGDRRMNILESRAT